MTKENNFQTRAFENQKNALTTFCINVNSKYIETYTKKSIKKERKNTDVSKAA